MRRRFFPAILAAACFIPSLTAAAPVYRTKLLHARSNFSGAHNLPNSAFFTNSTPDIADRAPGSPAVWPRIVTRIAVIGGSDAQAVWSGMGGAGGLAYTSPNVIDAYVSDATINNTGVIAAEQAVATPQGVFRVDTTNGNAFTLTITQGAPFGISSFGGALINNNQQIAYRGRSGFTGNLWVSWSAGAQSVHAAENSWDPQSPYSFLFTPAFNDARQIAGKVRLGAPGQTGNSQPDQIRLFNPDGSSTLIAEDRDSNPASNFAAFDNSVGVNAAGHVVFVANLVAPANTRAVFRSDGVTTTELARQGVNGLGSIEFFSPDINGNGLCVFRAFDSANKRAVWIADGATLRRVVSQDDLVPIDNAQTAQISENNPSDPCFGGAPRINAQGDVVFQAALIPPGQFAVELGSGLFVARASLQADATGDDLVNFADLNLVLSQFGQSGSGLSADLNGDGVVNFADLNLVLSEFGQSL